MILNIILAYGLVIVSAVFSKSCLKLSVMTSQPRERKKYFLTYWVILTQELCMKSRYYLSVRSKQCII